MNEPVAPARPAPPSGRPAPGPLRRLGARVVWALHVAVVTLVSTGWMLPFPFIWATVAVLSPVIQLLWWRNQDTCVLTSLEYWLRGEPMAGHPEQETFLGRLLEPVFGELSTAAISRISTGVNAFAFLACVFRLSR